MTFQCKLFIFSFPITSVYCCESFILVTKMLCYLDLMMRTKVSLFSFALIGQVMEQYLYGATKVCYFPQLPSEDGAILEMLR